MLNTILLQKYMSTISFNFCQSKNKIKTLNYLRVIKKTLSLIIVIVALGGILGASTVNTQAKDKTESETKAKSVLIKGTVYDIRYGEVLLGNNILRFNKNTAVYCKGIMQKSLDKWAVGQIGFAKCLLSDNTILSIEIVGKSLKTIENQDQSQNNNADKDNNKKSGEPYLPIWLVSLDKEHYKANDIVHLTMKAKSGQIGSFCIAGIAQIEAKETQPGLYTASYKVNLDDNVFETYPIGILREPKSDKNTNNNSININSRLGEAVSLSGSGAVICEVFPPKCNIDNNSINDSDCNDNKAIYVRYEIKGSLINAARSALWIDGKKITECLDILPEIIIFRPKDCAIFPGKHTASVKIADLAGNNTVYSWSFNY